MMKFKTILIDPPWPEVMSGKYKNPKHKAKPRLPYPTMTLDQIAAMNVEQYAAEGCHLWLWTTNRFIEAGFQILQEWGFTYLAPIHWIKPSGFGNYFIHRTQTILFGYYQKCLFLRDRYLPNIVEAPATKHSRKPAQFYQLIEGVSEEPRLEIFARPHSPMFPTRPGWTAWGNEMPNSPDLDLIPQEAAA